MLRAAHVNSKQFLDIFKMFCKVQTGLERGPWPQRSNWEPLMSRQSSSFKTDAFKSSSRRAAISWQQTDSECNQKFATEVRILDHYLSPNLNRSKLSPWKAVRGGLRCPCSTANANVSKRLHSSLAQCMSTELSFH